METQCGVCPSKRYFCRTVESQKPIVHYFITTREPFPSHSKCRSRKQKRSFALSKHIWRILRLWRSTLLVWGFYTSQKTPVLVLMVAALNELKRIRSNISKWSRYQHLDYRIFTQNSSTSNAWTKEQNANFHDTQKISSLCLGLFLWSRSIVWKQIWLSNPASRRNWLMYNFFWWVSKSILTLLRCSYLCFKSKEQHEDRMTNRQQCREEQHALFAVSTVILYMRG